jgi:hypothetical protein
VTVLDLYKAFKKVDDAQYRLERCEDVAPAAEAGQGSYFCAEFEESAAVAKERAEEIFNLLVDERIGEFLFERERAHEFD